MPTFIIPNNFLLGPVMIVMSY